MVNLVYEGINTLKLFMFGNGNLRLSPYAKFTILSIITYIRVNQYDAPDWQGLGSIGEQQGSSLELLWRSEMSSRRFLTETKFSYKVRVHPLIVVVSLISPYINVTMKLILMRHGESVAEAGSSERELTQKGRLDVTRVGDFISRTEWKITDIRHSPVLRTTQTADALLYGLGTQKPPLIEEPLLAPGFDIQGAKSLLSNYLASDVAIWVFHMPDVAQIAAGFLKANPYIFYVSQGTTITLNLNPTKIESASMIWSLSPEFL